MCLTRVTKKYGEPQKGVKVGYKAYRYLEGSKKRVKAYERELTIGKWYRSNSEGQSIESLESRLRLIGHPHDMDRYEPGFHIFRSESAARRYANEWGRAAIFQVEYDDVIYEGKNQAGIYDSPCHIARRMRIVEELPKKKRKAAL